MSTPWILLAMLTAVSPSPVIVEVGRYGTAEQCLTEMRALPRFADTGYACIPERVA